jgi:hypothetical protein
MHAILLHTKPACLQVHPHPDCSRHSPQHTTLDFRTVTVNPAQPSKWVLWPSATLLCHLHVLQCLPSVVRSDSVLRLLVHATLEQRLQLCRWRAGKGRPPCACCWELRLRESGHQHLM